MDFEFVFLNKKPLIGISNNSRHFDRFVLVNKFLSCNTVKKRIFKFIILLLILLKLDRLLLFKTSDLYSKHINSLCDKNGKHAFIRFHSLSKKSRCYCFFADNDLILTSFAKIAFDLTNSQLLSNEKEIISRIENSDIFKVSRVLNVYNNDDVFGFSVEAIPADFKVLDKKDPFISSALLTALRRNIKICEYNELQSFDWWLRFSSQHKYFSIINILQHIKSFRFSRVHGDLGSENILISTKSHEISLQTDNKKLFVIDWERCDYNAPFLTDALAYWLGYNHREILKKKAGIWLKTKFNVEFIQHYSNDKYNALAALAYLVSVDFDLAIILADSYCEELL